MLDLFIYHTIHILFIYYSYTIHILFIYYSYTIHILFIYYSYTIHILFIYYSYTIHILFKYYSYTTDILVIVEKRDNIFLSTNFPEIHGISLSLAFEMSSGNYKWLGHMDIINQWIGLREHLNRKPMVKLPSNIIRAFRCKFSHHPIL